MFPQKALWKLSSAKNMLFSGHGRHYLLPVYMKSLYGLRSTGD